MHLFCVGLSHHTANVETRERFIGHAEIDRVLRERVGCAEALTPHHLQPGRSLRRGGTPDFHGTDCALPAQ